MSMYKGFSILLSNKPTFLPVHDIEIRSICKTSRKNLLVVKHQETTTIQQKTYQIICIMRNIIN